MKTKKKSNNKKEVKKTNNTRNRSNKTSIKFEIDISMIVTYIIFIAIVIACYSIFGSKFALFISIGILLFSGIAFLFNKVKKDKKKRKILNFILIFFLLIAIAVCFLITAFCIYIVKESPEFDVSKLTKREASIVYDNNGEEIGRFGKELRENVSYDDLPEVFIDALIATEDSRYFQHNGIDAPRFIKASFGQALGKDAGGASTISMQVIKNNFTVTDLSNKRNSGIDGIVRKFEDVYLAVFKLEKNFTKEEIIEYYVNNHDLGNNAWGVEQASQTYFGKSVNELNLSESALLVGMFNNPTLYNPFKNPNNASSRRETVLNLMVSHGYITREEANYAKSIPVQSLLTEKKVTRDYQGYIDTVYRELINKYEIDPNTTSVLIYTNMDKERQLGIEDILNSKTFKWPNEAVESGIAVVETNTGKLVAVGAGRDISTALGTNRATISKRQIGSTAKPIFDYGPAIEYLNYSTYEQILDEPWAYSNGQVIGNSDGNFAGWISMRDALSQSRNIPALKTFQKVSDEVGNKKIVEFATSLGIEPEVASNGTIFEAHALGSFAGATPLQMAAAYAAFSNGGTYYEPYTINKIVFRDNNDVKTYKSEGTKVMSEATAYMITDMLISSVQSGAAGGIKANNATIAAKTGTTNFDASTKKKYKLNGYAVNDAWIVGYDPEYAIGMWYGYDKIQSDYYNKTTTVGTERIKLFNAIGKVVFNGGKKFTVPNSIQQICVEKGSNPPALPSSYTPEDQVVCEYFKKGSEPTTISTAYTKLDSVTGLKVSYNDETETISINWNKVEKPQDASDDFGDFGYEVFYNNVSLGFTQDTSFTITTNSNISGKYSVVVKYSEYDVNKSDPTVYEFVYTPPEPEPEPSPSPSETPTTTPTTTPELTPAPSPTTVE